MPDNLIPANPEDVASALAYALTHRAGKRCGDASELMARLVADDMVNVIEHNFAVLRRAAIPGHATKVGHRGEG
jgi:hypothetical protein